MNFPPLPRVFLGLTLFAAALVVAARLAAQTPAVMEPERWEDPDYPVVCYRFPGDASASCVVVPIEDEEESEWWEDG